MSEENALMRSIRLQRPDDALYWVSRLRNDGYEDRRIARRLYQCALRDNLRIDLMIAAEAAMNDVVRLNSDLGRLAVDLASSEKLWGSAIGRKLVALICSVQSDCSYSTFTNEELCGQIESSMKSIDRFMETLKIAHELWSRFKSPAEPCLEPFMTVLAARCDGTEFAVGMSLLRRCLIGRMSQVTIAEETLFYMLIAWAVTGVWGQEIRRHGLLHGDDVYSEVAVRLQSREPVPMWASAGDRRFEATWDGYANMSSMFDQNLRMSPDDPGSLFLVKNGEWVPVIRTESGLYMVQSEANPRQYYEVNLAILNCTCNTFVVRRKECKHIQAAREQYEESFPFTFA